MGELHLVKRALLGGLRRRKPNIGDICPADGPIHCGPGVYTLYRVQRATIVRGPPLAPLPCPQGGRGRRREASGELFGSSGALKIFPPHVVEKPLAGKEIDANDRLDGMSISLRGTRMLRSQTD